MTNGEMQRREVPIYMGVDRGREHDYTAIALRQGRRILAVYTYDYHVDDEVWKQRIIAIAEEWGVVHILDGAE